MADQEVQVQRQVPIIRERNPDATVYYSNDSLIQHTNWEVQLSFGRVLAPISANAEISEVKIALDVVVIMSLKHAEAFAKALTEHIEKTREDWRHTLGAEPSS